MPAFCGVPSRPRCAKKNVPSGETGGASSQERTALGWASSLMWREKTGISTDFDPAGGRGDRRDPSRAARIRRSIGPCPAVGTGNYQGSGSSLVFRTGRRRLVVPDAADRTAPRVRQAGICPAIRSSSMAAIRSRSQRLPVWASPRPPGTIPRYITCLCRTRSAFRF